jgi:DNA polymerase-3 subunit chi
LLACRLAEKAYRLGHRVCVQTESAIQTRIMDDLLWTFRPGSFVPHAIDSGSANPTPPVVLGHDSLPQCGHDVLINLSPEVLADYERFERIIELVDDDEAVRQAGRRRYRYYQDNGHPLATHKLDGGQGRASVL